jgi:nitrite reductase/ring-hydroxylating ferredoxin subunit
MAKQLVKVATRDEIPPGCMKLVEVGSVQVALCNVNGRYYAVHDECTHETFPLTEGKLDGHVLTCMLHGAQFDVRTGKVLQPPAYEPVRTYEVAVEGEDVFLELS